MRSELHWSSPPPCAPHQAVRGRAGAWRAAGSRSDGLSGARLNHERGEARRGLPPGQSSFHPVKLCRELRVCAGEVCAGRCGRGGLGGEVYAGRCMRGGVCGGGVGGEECAGRCGREGVCGEVLGGEVCAGRCLTVGGLLTIYPPGGVTFQTAAGRRRVPTLLCHPAGYRRVVRCLSSAPADSVICDCRYGLSAQVASGRALAGCGGALRGWLPAAVQPLVASPAIS